MKKLGFIVLMLVLAVSVVFSATKEWTFMVYLDGDNNLEPESIDDFNEMAAVGSNDNVNIVLQYDRASGYSTASGNWTDTRRFLVQKGNTPSSTPLQKMGEINMGDGNSLKDFIVWAITNYPAKKYALVAWNHGGGWRIRGPKAKVYKAVCWDEGSNDDCLYMLEFQSAVKSALQQVSVAKLDIIAFDACLMGMVEVASDIKDVAKVMVGSEEVEPGAGWPYTPILTQLEAAPTMDAKSLSTIIVDEYNNSYKGEDASTTQGAIDLSKIDDLNGKVKTFVSAANQWSKIKSARTATRMYSEADGYPHGDLYHFMNNIKAKGVTDPAVLSAAEDVKTAVKNAVINVKYGSSRTNTNGLSIFFPKTKTDYNNADGSDYKNHAFTQATGWDGFLKNYFNPPADHEVGGASVDGTGAATLSRTTPVKVGAKLSSVTYYYTASAAMTGGQVTIDVPAGWTPPSTTVGGAGEVTLGNYSGVNCSITSVSGQTITVNTTTLPKGKKFKIAYKKSVAPKSAGTYKFITKSKGKSGNLKEISSSPYLTVQ